MIEDPIILIVEDEEQMAGLLAKVVQPLMKHWPKCKVIFARTLKDAMLTIAASPPPSIVLLDLTLTDSQRQNTISKIEQMEERSPLIIVSGSAREEIMALLNDREVEIISKDDALSSGNFLVLAILRVIKLWNEKKWLDFDAKIVRMREILNDNRG